MNIEIGSLFAPDGLVAAQDERFEERPQQVAMAEAVWEALVNERGLVVEAGTGVGKSLAYLLPAALWAVANNTRVLVSTHTRALQEQLLERELPLVERVLREMGLVFRHAMLMGADNYLCVERLRRAALQPSLQGGGDGALLQQLRDWASTATTAHRSALPRLVPASVWHRIVRDPDLCQGSGGGRWADGCLYRRDRERAERSHLLVVNHALLLSGARLPAYDALIVDEAHTFEDAASSHFGLAASQSRGARLVSDAEALARAAAASGEALLGEAGRAAEAWRAFLDQVACEHGRKEGDLEPGGRLLDEAERELPGALARAEAALGELAVAFAGKDLELEARTLQLRFAGLRHDAESILSASDSALARWVQWGPWGVELRAAPLEVGERLADALLSRGMPVIMTSATLSSGRGLAAFKRAVGFDGARELALDSPFDYEKQAALLLWDGLPEPSEDEDYAKELAAACKAVVKQVPGGVFLLFSSWKMMRRVHAKLRRSIKDRPLWIQGDAGHEALVSEFMSAGNAVLLGVDTFWQGVDVPGSALSCVVLVKLPFPNLASPVEEARRKHYESLEKSYFGEYSLPKAVLKLRQGFGRLIRSAADRGAVVILDPRIRTKRYGASFLEALPKCRRLKDVSELGEFFAEQDKTPA